MNKNPIALSVSLLTLSLLSVASTAAAQGQSTPSFTGGLEEVLVTAQRREQSLLSIPMSIQATSGEQLNLTGIRDLTSMQFNTPGYFPDTNNGFVQIYMRGIGNAVFVGADPSVATFVDDVPQIYGVTVDTLADIERVEVLKGAQGGLYGRNATAGVVNIITRSPSTEAMMGEFRAGYGTKGTFNGAAWFNLPIGEAAAWTLSVERSTHDPYVSNRAPATPYAAEHFPEGSFLGSPQQTADFFNAPQNPSKIFDKDFWSVRSKLLLEPSDSFSFTLSGSYAEKDDTSSSQFYSSTPGFNQAALEGLLASFGVVTDLPPGFILGNSGGDWTTAIGPEVYARMRDYSVSGTALWHGPGFDLTSITAYRELTTSTSGDSATSMVAFVPFIIDFDRDYIYQEFRALSTLDGPWRFLAGATYLENNLSGRNDVFFLSYAVPFGSTEVDQTITNWSVYGEVGYDLTDRLSLTVSGRYMREKNEADFSLPVESGTDSLQKKFVPSATLSHALDQGVVYARWARGFKTGGVNIVTAPAFYPSPSDGSVFGPESVDTYEIGFRTALLDRTLQVTGAVFYNDYRDLQVDVRARPEFPEVTTAIINADSARTWGIEGGLAWQVTDAITLGVNGGYLDAEYKNFALSDSPVLADFDLGGKRMPKAPKRQLSVDAALDQPLANGLRLVGNVLVAHNSGVIFKYSALPGVLPDAEGGSYWLVNARAGVKTADDRVAFHIVADNLFDEVYYIGADAGMFGNLLNYGTRRIIRGEVTYKF